MAEHDRRRHAEKACQRAEMFLAGNVRGALRQATATKRLWPSLTLATDALDAYEVHAAAAAAARPANWRAVLGFAAGAAKQADIRRRFRRLSALVHPDRNLSAAAVGALRLLLQAYDALSNRSDASSQLPWWMERDARLAARHHHHPPPCGFKVIYCKFCKGRVCQAVRPSRGAGGMMCEDCRK